MNTGETPGSAQVITGEYRSVYEMCAFVSFGRTELKMCGEMWGDVGVRRQSIPKPPNTRSHAGFLEPNIISIID